MPNEYPRSRRLADQIQRVLSSLLHSEVKDPRVNQVTLTEVRVSGDLGVATVLFSLLDPEADPDPVGEALRGAGGFLRGRLGRELHVRRVPELRFRYDDRVRQDARLAELIREARDSDDRRAHDSVDHESAPDD